MRDVRSKVDKWGENEKDRIAFSTNGKQLAVRASQRREKNSPSILVTDEYHWHRKNIIACTCSDNSEVCVKWCELLFVYVWICCQ